MVKKCFIFGNKIDESIQLYQNLKDELEAIILKHDIKKFLFSESGKFSYICYELLSDLKEKYCEIERVYCYSENILKQDFCKYKQLSKGLYDDFLCLCSGFDNKRNECIELLKIIDICDLILLNFKEKGAMVDFIKNVSNIKNKEIIFFNEE